MKHLKEKYIYNIFVLTLGLKALNALLEIFGGILFLFRGTLTKILSFLITKELIEDPQDFVANSIQHLIPYLSAHTQFFITFYLLSHGVVKIFLIINLLRKKLWAYPATVIVLIFFILYQVYRIFNSFSWFLLVLTVFDMILIALTWHEYKLVSKKIIHIE